MTSFQFLISPALLSGLAGLVPGEKSPLSPLNISKPPELDSDQRAELISAGVLDNVGLVEPARLLLASLSESPSFARLRLSAPGGYLDEAIHFTGEGSNTVGISNTPDGLVIASPGDTETILARVGELTGASIRPLPTWSVGLPAFEMLVLASLLDLRRKAVLRAIIDQQPVILPPGDPQAVLAAIQSMWSNPQWLVAAIQNIAGISALPAVSQIQAALASLSDKQLVWPQGGNFMPMPEAITVIDRFLLIGNILTLDAGNSNLQDAFSLTRHSWLQAGITEMLHLTRDGENVLMEVVSPAAALEKIRFFLTTFDAVPAPPLKSVALSLVIQAGLGVGQIFPLEDETVLGRGEQASMRILDSRASRRHAVVRKLSQGYQLSDAGSTNGTYLNGQFLTTPSWLHEGDLIAIGETQIKVIRAGETLPEVESDRTVYVGAAQPVPPPPAPEPLVEPAPQPAPQVIFTPDPLPPSETAAPPATEVFFMPAPEPPAESSLPPVAEEISQPVFEPPAVEEINPLTPEPVFEPGPPPAPEPVVAAIPAEPPALEPVAEIPPLEILVEEPIPPAPVIAPPPEPFEAPIPSEQPPEPESVLCARCHEPIQPGDWLCRNCGQPVDQPVYTPPAEPVVLEPVVPPAQPLCPNCGNPTNPGARFCGACGYRLLE